MKQFQLLLALIVPILGIASSVSAIERRDNLLKNPSFESDDTSWFQLGEGFVIDKTTSHTGKGSLKCVGESLESIAGAKQVITFDTPIMHPIRISGWSRAKDVEVSQDYNIYIDAFHSDDSPLWGQIAHFKASSHDWEYTEFIFTPAKPLCRIEVHLLFRLAKGTVWFDDVKINLAP